MQRYHIGLALALIKGSGAVEVATPGHFRHRDFVDCRLRPLARALVGTAVTVAIPGTNSPLLRHAIATIRPGDVLAIDRLGDRRHACPGDGMAPAAEVAGAIATRRAPFKVPVPGCGGPRGGM